jgi:hypothetical protein
MDNRLFDILLQISVAFAKQKKYEHFFKCTICTYMYKLRKSYFPFFFFLFFFSFFFYKSLGYFCWNCFPIVNFTFQQNTHVHPCLTNHMYIILQYLCTLTYMYKLCKSYFPFLICFHFFPGTVFLL